MPEDLSPSKNEVVQKTALEATPAAEVGSVARAALRNISRFHLAPSLAASQKRLDLGDKESVEEKLADLNTAEPSIYIPDAPIQGLRRAAEPILKDWEELSAGRTPLEALSDLAAKLKLWKKES